MKNKQDIRNKFLKNKGTKLLSIDIVVLMLLTALPIFVTQISSTPLSPRAAVCTTDGFGNLQTDF